MARQPRTPRPRRGVSQYDKARVIVVNGFSLIINSPYNGQYLATTSPQLNITPASVAGVPVDVQIEWRNALPYYSFSVLYPAAYYTQLVTALPSGVPVNISPPAVLAKGTWWYRIRVGNSGTNTWGAWSDLYRTLNLTLTLGSVSSYIDMNVGAGSSPLPNTFAYMDFNVGSTPVPPDSFNAYSEINVGAFFDVVTQWFNYSDVNIGPPVVPTDNAYHYSEFNVDTSDPTPHIWWIRPDFGREGYVFNIYGHGFGSFQNEYNGIVMLGAYVCPVIRWERIPAVAPPDTIVKGVDAESDIIKPEHGWIVVVVPTHAVTDYVKVILEGAE